MHAVALFAAAPAYVPAAMPTMPVTRAAAPQMSEDVSRRSLVTTALGASAFLGAAAANAEVDYAGVGYLGGSSIIDVNNANIRVYAKLPGMYPNVCTKLIKNTPYKSASEMYSKGGFSSAESAVLKKYESRFIFLEPKPEYVIDMLNNGLYR